MSSALEKPRPYALRAVPVSSQIYDVMRESIVMGQMAPGSPVSEKAMSESYGVSRTPVREALLRLADEGLIDIFPQRGTFVSRIPLANVRDSMVLRHALERVAVREAAGKATKPEIAELRYALERQRANNRSLDLRSFHLEDEAFHQRIGEIAGHPNLWRVIRREKVQVDRCRVLHLPMSERRAVVIDEHKAIVDALEAGDADAAERAMYVHLQGVFPSVTELQDAYPGYFEP